MEPDIAEMLKDAFSGFETEFENLQFDEDTNAPHTHPTMDADIDLKDANELCSTSDQSSFETLANIYKPEKNEDPDRGGSTDSNEETGCAICPSQELNSDDQAAEMLASEEPQENQLCAQGAVEEQDMNSDEDEVSMHELVGDSSILEEEHDPCDVGPITYSLGSVENNGMQSEEYQEIFSPPVLTENQTPEEMSSGSDEEGPGNENTEERTLQCDSDDNMDKSLTAMKPDTPVGHSDGDDLKEFTEDDQEGVKESLAEYPSDLFQSEGEEQAKSARDQASALTDNSFGKDSSTSEMKHVSCVEDYMQARPMDFTSADSNDEIQGLEDQLTPEKADICASFQEEKVYEDDLQELLTNYGSTEEADASNQNDQPDYDSDISSDHSTGHEEPSFSSSVKHEEEWKSDIQHINFIKDLGRVEEDIDYIATEDRDGSYPEVDKDFPNAGPVLCREYSYEESDEQSIDLRSTLESVQSDPSIKQDEQSLSEILNAVTNIRSLIPEELWSLHASISDDSLPLDNYDWSFTGEEPCGMNLDEGENQESTEDLEELDIDEDVEENERDWEQEKTRIEAFYRFYDGVDTEDSPERNHKVTFCLDQEFSENEEDSDSSEQELDEVPDTLENAVKRSEYHSESEDEPQEKPFHPEKAKVRPKEQQPVSPAQNTHPPRRKCLAVLKSVLALGLMTVIGMASFWWATDNLDWIH